jgi:hypothetical protein
MKRRTFLEIALVLGAGLASGAPAGLAWSRREGFPGLRVRLDGLTGAPRGARLHIVDLGSGGERVLLDQPLATVDAEWRIPALCDHLEEAVHALEARLVDADGRVLERTDPPLDVRFRAFRFSS